MWRSAEEDLQRNGRVRKEYLRKSGKGEEASGRITCVDIPCEEKKRKERKTCGGKTLARAL